MLGDVDTVKCLRCRQRVWATRLMCRLGKICGKRDDSPLSVLASTSYKCHSRVKIVVVTAVVVGLLGDDTLYWL